MFRLRTKYSNNSGLIKFVNVLWSRKAVMTFLITAYFQVKDEYKRYV